NDRCGDPEAAQRLVLPGLAAGAAQAGRGRPGHGGRHVLPARGLHPADGQAGRDVGDHPAFEVAGLADGRRARRRGGGLPHPTAAIGATLPGASWQRCRTHYTVNLMSVTPKASWPWVRALLHSVFDQPDAPSVQAQFDRAVEALIDKLPAVAEHLQGARADVL